LTATLFQDRIPKVCETRITVVDGRLFTARIHADSDAARADWRADYDSLTIEPCPPPPAVAAAVLRLLDAFQLPYGCLDFALTGPAEDPDSWWFLELNAAGQYGFVEQATGLAITAAICDYLEEGGPP
jgi:hypothetical protein